MDYRPKNFIFQQPKGKGGAPLLVTILSEAHSSPTSPLCMHRPPSFWPTSLPEKREPLRSSSSRKRVWARLAWAHEQAHKGASRVTALGSFGPPPRSQPPDHCQARKRAWGSVRPLPWGPTPPRGCTRGARRRCPHLTVHGSTSLSSLSLPRCLGPPLPTQEDCIVGRDDTSLRSGSTRTQNGCSICIYRWRLFFYPKHCALLKSHFDCSVGDSLRPCLDKKRFWILTL